MSRKTAFSPDREPLRDRSDLLLNDHKIGGPFSFLNPTEARYEYVTENKSSAESSASEHLDKPAKPTAPQGDLESTVGYKWRSRDNRKGRHALVVKFSDHSVGQYVIPPPTNGPSEVAKTMWKMCSYYPIWDVSYLVAIIFTWGSVVWVINAFFAFLPFTNPSSAFPNETLYGGGISAFIGATIFEFGSILLMLEAINENRAGCFGWALERAYTDHFSHTDAEHAAARISPDSCSHHHSNRKNLVGTGAAKDVVVSADEKNPAPSADSTPPGARSWIWWPSWYELHTHYLHELGFLACCSQMFGATIFWISGFTALPGIYNKLAPIALLNGIYWVPQVIGGAGFVVSGLLFMIETQKHWWQPAPKVLGWHIGLWNLIGGIGFTLCPIFGFSTAYWREYQASCSTFWASWAFLIGSVIQWYESLDKHPVETSKEA